jgi:hypothetical protein
MPTSSLSTHSGLATWPRTYGSSAAIARASSTLPQRRRYAAFASPTGAAKAPPSRTRFRSISESMNCSCSAAEGVFLLHLLAFPKDDEDVGH